MHELVIHIGMGKAASTTIQKSVLSHPDAPVNICRHNIEELKKKRLKQLWWRGLVSPPSPIAEKAKKILINKYLHQHHLVVLSDESISTSPLLVDNLIKNIENLNAKIKFLFITRNQITFLPSLYNHSMRSKVFALGVPRLNTEMLNRMEYKGDIDTWIEDLISGHDKGDRNILENILYHITIKKLYNSVGKKSSIIMPVEMLSFNRKEFSIGLSKAFHMDPGIIIDRLDNKKNVTGSRLRDYKMGRLIKTCYSNPAIKSLCKSANMTEKKSSKFVTSVLSIFSNPDIEKIDQKSKYRIQKKFSLSNRKYEEMTGWDLEKLNYPLSNR